MDSSAKFTVNRPIRLDPTVLEKLNGIARAFCDDSLAHVRSAYGLDAGRFPDLAAIAEPSGSSVPWHAVVSARALLGGPRWAAVLADGTSLTGLTREQVTGLHNAGRSKITSIAVEVRTESTRLSVGFEEPRYGAESGNIAISGPFDLVRKYRSELQDWIQSATQIWWPCRDGRIINGVMLLLSAAWFASVAYLWSTTEGAPGTKVETLVAVVGAAMVGAFVWYFPIKIWRWGFPMIDLQFGGGVQLSQMRRNVRWALWAVPITMVLIPYAVNQL